MRTVPGTSRARRPATVAALVVVAIVAVFQTAAIFLVLGAQRDAAHMIDISGAQRMRSQQLAYLTLALHAGVSGEAAIDEKIESIVSDMIATRTEISHEPRYISGPRDANGHTTLGVMATRYIATVRAVEHDPRDASAFTAVREQRVPMLAAFDDAVKARVEIANGRVDQLAAALLLGLLLQIASIAGVWFSIVAPSERRNAELLADVRAAREEIESIFAGNPDAISVYDARGHLVRVNSSRAKLLGYPPETLTGRHFTEFVSPSYCAEMILAFDRAIGGETVQLETKLLALDRSMIDVDVTLFPRYVENTLAGVNIVSKDMRELRAAEAANAEQARRLSDLYEIASAHDRTPDELLHSAIGLVTARLGYDFGALSEIDDGVVTVISTYGNPKGLVPGDRRPLENSLASLALTVEDVFEARDFQAVPNMNATIRGYGWQSVAGMKIKIDGKLYGAVGFASRTMRGMDLSGADTGFVRLACALLATIVERGRQIRRLDSLAFSDQLTGLPNRTYFTAALNDFVEMGTPFALHYVDLDRFKKVNDRFGHSVGDLVLGVTAKRLSHCARTGDVVARLGGDEFAILQMGPIDLEGASALASRVIAAFSEPVDLGGIAHDVGASVGVALFPMDAMDARGLVEAADTALYRAKRAGRRRISYFMTDGEREGLATA